MEAARAIGIAQEAVREVGDKLGSRERAKANNLAFIEVKVEADVSRTLLHKTESRRDCANIASKDAIIKVEGGEVQGALLKLGGGGGYGERPRCQECQVQALQQGEQHRPCHQTLPEQG